MRATVRDEAYQQELIGLRVRLVGASDPGQAGLCGVIADETRQTLLIETSSGMKRVPKAGSRFEVSPAAPGPDGAGAGTRGPLARAAVLSGDALVYRPEDRIKKNAPRGRSARGRRGARAGENARGADPAQMRFSR